MTFFFYFAFFFFIFCCCRVCFFYKLVLGQICVPVGVSVCAKAVCYVTFLIRIFIGCSSFRKKNGNTVCDCVYFFDLTNKTKLQVQHTPFVYYLIYCTIKTLFIKHLRHAILFWLVVHGNFK